MPGLVPEGQGEREPVPLLLQIPDGGAVVAERAFDVARGGISLGEVLQADGDPGRIERRLFEEVERPLHVLQVRGEVAGLVVHVGPVPERDRAAFQVLGTRVDGGQPVADLERPLVETGRGLQLAGFRLGVSELPEHVRLLLRGGGPVEQVQRLFAPAERAGEIPQDLVDDAEVREHHPAGHGEAQDLVGRRGALEEPAGAAVVALAGGERAEVGEQARLAFAVAARDVGRERPLPGVTGDEQVAHLPRDRPPTGEEGRGPLPPAEVPREQARLDEREGRIARPSEPRQEHAPELRRTDGQDGSRRRIHHLQEAERGFVAPLCGADERVLQRLPGLGRLVAPLRCRTAMRRALARPGPATRAPA